MFIINHPAFVACVGSSQQINIFVYLLCLKSVLHKSTLFFYLQYFINIQAYFITVILGIVVERSLGLRS